MQKRSEIFMGRVGSKILEIFIVCWKIYPQWSSNLSMLIQSCNAHFTMFDFAIHYIFNKNLTTCRKLILYFENLTFRVVVSWSGRRNGPVDTFVGCRCLKCRFREKHDKMLWTQNRTHREATVANTMARRIDVKLMA